jgi:hypothetical protein
MEKLVIINEAKEQLQKTVAQLEIVTTKLAQRILLLDVVACKFVHIPELTMEDEKHRIIHGQPRQIIVSNGPLNSGLEDAVQRFHFFYTKYGMSTRFSPNFPGLICIKDSSEEISDLVAMANELKQKFSQIIRTMTDKLKEQYQHESLDQLIFDVIHGPMPMILTECITRKIQLLEEPITSASFSMRTNLKKNLVGRIALVEKLENQIGKANRDNDRQLCEHLLNELNIVKNSNFEVFGYPKYTTPTPTLTIKSLIDAKTLNYRACLPLIVLNQADTKPIIHEMANYDADIRDRRKKRKTDSVGVLIYSHSGLHGYE